MGFMDVFFDAIRLNDDDDEFDNEEYDDFDDDDEEEERHFFRRKVKEEPEPEKVRSSSRSSRSRDDSSARSSRRDDDSSARSSRSRDDDSSARSSRSRDDDLSVRSSRSRDDDSSVRSARGRDDSSVRQAGAASRRSSQYESASAARDVDDRPQKSQFRTTTSRRSPVRREDKMEVSVIKPSSIDDEREITETLMSGRAVVINMEGLNVDIAQRIIDFTSGSTFAIDGTLQKISNFIFIATPRNVDVSGDLQTIMDSVNEPSFGF